MKITCFRFIPRSLACLFLLAGLPGLVALSPPALAQSRGGPSGPTEVGVMTVTRTDVPVTVELPGRAVAYQMAAVRPKVGGEITEIPYEAGTVVEAGTVLFRLEDETLAVELAAREVAVTSATAAKDGAQATVDRYRKLSGSGVTQADLESAVVFLAAAQAALGSAELQRDLAELALRRTEILSPIRGIPAVTPFSIGDTVSENQSEALTSVAQIDPIYVDVSESRARILRHQRSIADGNMQRLDSQGIAELTLETGETYARPGHILAPGNEVSATTGTIPIRVQFPNPDRQILPGQFVRVTLTIGQINAFLVPQRATSRAASGQLTAFVARDGKAVQVRLTEAGTHQNAWMVTDGLQEGDALILDGLTNLRDGAAVTTLPVEIDAEGVVRDADKAEAPNAADGEASGALTAAEARSSGDAGAETDSAAPGNDRVTGDPAPADQPGTTTTPDAAPVSDGPVTGDPASAAPPRAAAAPGDQPRTQAPAPSDGG